ncbi:MAG TPA: hypothetical protein VNQ55_03665 [Parapedobacter sp.]|nr:hypothetical protein [Parapedobacter sp.]
MCIRYLLYSLCLLAVPGESVWAQTLPVGSTVLEDYAVTIVKDSRNNWVDASLAAYGTWDYKQFIFNAHLQYIHAYNYQYNFRAAEDRSDYWGFHPQDKNNLHLKVGVMYRLSTREGKPL